ncbi:MAG: molecular chaperone HtpG [Halobacteriovoraceae bacterium]|jgi:molecular chaperone HtpG|nr:molecular chaperone HtpG [Halobacteriovoraceae bacterium]
MGQRKGTISVKTGDIFPIIKKWLYSEHDIFLRELVANATDAISKRATLARTRNQEIPTPRIDVLLNKTKKTITICDNGLGMTEEEVEKYISQLAFSGAEEFIKKMEKEGQKADEVIGKFGLGFYSSFMVAGKVVVDSLSMEEGSVATRWTCDGDTEYTFSESDRKEVGTSITLHANEDGIEFLDKWKLINTLKNFCDYMPSAIYVLDCEEAPVKATKEDGSVDETAEATPVEPTLINDTTPIWRKDPKELSDDDYKAFYRKQFPMDQDPLFWIHLKIDHPFTLEGILYFPKLNPQKPMNERNIRLYCKQVFVSDDVKNIIPDFLSLLKGSIDSTDIPLNVSRSALQGDPNVRRINSYIVKKVADALKTLFKKDREKYESIWQDIGLFVKYGIVSDTKFDETMRERVIFKNGADKFQTLPEYRESIPAEYREKMGEKVLYFESGKSDYSLRSQLHEAGLTSFETEEHIDPHFMQHVEMQGKEENKVQFVSVDSEFSNLMGTENTTPEDIKIKDLFVSILAPEKAKEEGAEEKPAFPMEGGLAVEVEKVKNAKAPAYFKVDEQMKRFARMTQSMGQPASFPVKKTLVINPGNPLIQNAMKIHEKGGNNQLVEKIAHHVEDLAAISSQGLKNEEKDQFVQRTQDLIQELTSLAL